MGINPLQNFNPLQTAQENAQQALVDQAKEKAQEEIKDRVKEKAKEKLGNMFKKVKNKVTKGEENAEGALE